MSDATHVIKIRNYREPILLSHSIDRRGLPTEMFACSVRLFEKMISVFMEYQRCLLPICVLFLYFVSTSDAATRKGCSLDVIRNPNEKILPVLLHNQTTGFTLIVPNQGYINLNYGEEMTLLCPDPKNVLVATNSNSTFATCIGDTTIRIFGKPFDFNELLCKSRPQGNIQKTTKKCGHGNGKIINIGYQVTKHHSVTLIKVCYDEVEGNTLYTEHTLYGAEIKYASKTSDRPSFSTSGLGPQIAANIAFKKVFQKSTFNQLLGSSCAHEQYINSNSFLSRGHLSPDADFISATSQFITYFYINTCPQWQTINAGNWQSVEHMIRKSAEHYKDEFTIITGTHDVLKLPGEHCRPTSIFLVSGSKLPVPKFIWKIVYNEKSHRGIAIISLNNPFVDLITEDEILCRNVCNQYGWVSDKWTDIKKGYIYCCDIKELASIVKSVPYLKVSGVLTRNP